MEREAYYRKEFNSHIEPYYWYWCGWCSNVIEIYYQLFDNFTIINEFDIIAYDARTLVEFEKYKGKLGFVDSGIITTMNQHQITNLVTFDKEFKKVKSINVVS